MSPGWFLIGMACGLILGALASYGFMFAWAIKYGREEDPREED